MFVPTLIYAKPLFTLPLKLPPGCVENVGVKVITEGCRNKTKKIGTSYPHVEMRPTGIVTTRNHLRFSE